jgi:hypothetical protein
VIKLTRWVDKQTIWINPRYILAVSAWPGERNDMYTSVETVASESTYNVTELPGTILALMQADRAPDAR